MAERALTVRQARFAEAYAGNATQAAIAAGYSAKSAANTGRELLRVPAVARMVEEREKKESRPLVANRRQRQEFWTAVMRDGEARLADRLKASELLGKSGGDFLERVEHSGEIAGRRVTAEEAAEAMKKRIEQNRAEDGGEAGDRPAE